MKGAGRGNGEPHENFNAQLGPLGKTTMYMLPTSRMVSYQVAGSLASGMRFILDGGGRDGLFPQGRLERVVQQLHEEKELRLPQQLMRMVLRAAAARDAARRDIAAAAQQLESAFGLTTAQVCGMLPEMLAVGALLTCNLHTSPPSTRQSSALPAQQAHLMQQRMR